MKDSRRFLLLLLSGLLFFSGSIVAVFKTTEPAQAVVDNPILEVSPAPTTTTSPPTTLAPLVETTAAAPRQATSRPVTPPRNSYQPEPIREIGTIEIPKIGLTHRIMHGISMRNIDLGPSHWPGTALPGENGNTVFAGHRVTKTKPFRNIDQLVPGDEVVFTVNGVRSRYLVTGHEIVAPTRVDIVTQTPTPTGTLFACHPPGSAKQRYVVRLALAADQ